MRQYIFLQPNVRPERTVFDKVKYLPTFLSIFKKYHIKKNHEIFQNKVYCDMWFDFVFLGREKFNFLFLHVKFSFQPFCCSKCRDLQTADMCIYNYVKLK